MMDANELFPNGIHPCNLERDRFVLPLKGVRRRIDVAPVRYFIIDFGISRRFSSGEETKITGIDGIDRDVPERSKTVPYDPFMVDIFTLGNEYKKQLLQVRKLTFCCKNK